MQSYSTLKFRINFKEDCGREPGPQGFTFGAFDIKYQMALASFTKLIILQILLFLVCAVVYRRVISPEKTEVTAIGEVFDGGDGDVKVVYGVKIERNPSQSKLDRLGVSSWPTWSGGPSKIPWTFKDTETMYLLEGKVKIYCDGHDDYFEIGARDLVQFPKGMIITWDVIEAVKKHYNVAK